MNKRILLLGLATLCGCTLGPDYKRPDTVSDAQIKAALNIADDCVTVDRQWHKSFGDSKLNDLIDLALSDNPDVNAAIEKLKQARIALEIQGVQYYPTFDLSGGYTKLKPSKNVFGAAKESYYQAGLDASWELDLWGAGRRLTENAQAAANAAAASLDDVRLTLKAEIINNYISLRQAQEQLRLLNRTLKLQNKIARLSADKAKSGLISQTDLVRARYAVDSIKAQIPSVKTAISLYKNNLTLLTGKLPEQLNSLLNDTAQNIIRDGFIYNPSALAQIPADALRTRPDVRAAEQALVAQNALIGNAIANLFPTVSFSGFFGFQADHLNRLARKSSDMFSLAPGIKMPLFHWGALFKQVDLEKSATKEAASAYQKAVLNAASEVKNAIVSVSEQIVQTETNTRALDKMRNISALTLAQYDSGLIPLDSTLSVMQDVLKAKTAVIQSKGAFYQAVVGFYKSIGY
ncbi:MAG: efflux transporter outer membrane subunit [Alphaproteobacteria bacterium]|nr:efflux transporter outer membrane subunit [Alphaproteobacteria bacterium]MBO4644659.1 efflux transporter outer membrane subunit [Alphaproteobacteria bacterium]